MVDCITHQSFKSLNIVTAPTYTPDKIWLVKNTILEFVTDFQYCKCNIAALHFYIKVLSTDFCLKKLALTCPENSEQDLRMVIQFLASQTSHKQPLMTDERDASEASIPRISLKTLTGTLLKMDANIPEGVSPNNFKIMYYIMWSVSMIYEWIQKKLIPRVCVP